MRAVRLLVALAVAVPLAGAGVVLRGQDRDPDIKIAGGGTLPTSWQARTDKNRPLADANIVTMGDGLHVTLGPAVVAAATSPTPATVTRTSWCAVTGSFS